MSISGGWESPLSWAISAMVLFAAIFEPVRQVLLHQQSTIGVGGVGGVGGLANLGAPNEDCVDQFHGKYCYILGDVGPFTWFAVATLVCWVGPFLVAFVWIAVSQGTPKPPQDGSGDNLPNLRRPLASPLTPQPTKLTWPVPVWIGLNVLWFVFPWLSFAFGLHEIQGRFSRQVLALALGASHPLSWNLSFVVIPTGGPLSELLLGIHNGNAETANSDSIGDGSNSNNTTNHNDTELLMKSFWFPFHRLVGYTTAFWGVLHGVGELVYLLTSRERMQNFLEIRTDGETLLYWAGLLTLLLLLAHSAGAYFRKQWNQTQRLSFRTFHRLLAVALLLVAAAHWWPFALLFVPATAIHGVAMARCHQDKRCTTSARILALQLATAMLASVSGVSLVWSVRQDYMMQSTANLYVPFVFPPLCVAISLVASYSTTTALGWAFARLLSRDEEGHYHHQPQELVDGARTPLLRLEIDSSSHSESDPLLSSDP